MQTHARNSTEFRLNSGVLFRLFLRHILDKDNASLCVRGRRDQALESMPPKVMEKGTLDVYSG